MDIAEIKRLLETEVPNILRESPGFTDWLRDFVSRQSVSKESFDERFDRMMKEFAADREEQRRLWDEQRQKWDVQEQRWQDHKKELAAQEQRWRAQEEKWKAQEKKWDAQEENWKAQEQRWWAQEKKWDAQEENRKAQEEKWQAQEEKWKEENRRWNENQEFLRAFARRYEQSIGALGARWGLASESSFRGALQGILRDSFGVQVLNVTEFDDEGLVFGRPDQVELDVIIKNGTLILCELKSSISKGDVFVFERKILYYEKRHQRSANRRIIVSPMVDPKARALADTLGMEVFSYAEEVSGLA